uniref:Uncharacterized protein n=1 Tax=Rhizophora mucronata TaxID=61149 RepID=A0A2P2PH76_RHIMU
MPSQNFTTLRSGEGQMLPKSKRHGDNVRRTTGQQTTVVYAKNIVGTKMKDTF